MQGGRRRSLLGVTGSGKTFTMAHVVARGEPADAGDRAQQDAGGAALPRVQDALSRQRRALLRQLLRLLPAGGVRPEHRHVHREGRVDQRRDRQDAPLGDQGAARAHATCSSSPASRASTASARRRRTSTCWSSSSAARRADRDQVLRKLVDIQYERNDFDFHRGTFRVRGDVVEVFPAYEENARAAHRVLRRRDRGDRRDRSAARPGRCARFDRVAIYPASHYVTEPDRA